MKFTKVFALILVLFLLGFAAIGCGGGDSVAPAGDESVVTDEEPIIIRMAHTDTTARSTHVALEWLPEHMYEKTGGRVIVELYPDGQLGDDPELCKGLLIGTTQVYMGLTGVLGGIVGPQLDMFDLPFLYNSYDEWLEGSFEKGGLEIYNELLVGSGFTVVDFMYNGMMNIASSKKIYKTPEDMKGFKVRVVPTDMNVAVFEALGANPTPLAWGEVYTSVAQGAVDGLTHALGVFNDFKFYEMAPYITLSEHQSSPYTVVMSTEFLESLPDDIYDIWMDAIREACSMQREMERELEFEYIETFLNSGATVHESTLEEKAVFFELCAAIYDNQREITGADVFDRFLSTAGK
ncbi:MAG: TRAP transporter substrate-binding protein [Dethiobacteria bacterium]|nr:TRAP transporter substrate-binding protein [Dethiobacteria bacterium]